MPHSDLHKKKLSKNLIMLAIILGFMVLIWMVTMIKMANAQDQLSTVERTAETELEYSAKLSDTNEDGSRRAKHVFDIEESYIETRQAHLEDQQDDPERWWYEDLSLHSEDDREKAGRPLDVYKSLHLLNNNKKSHSIGGFKATRP